MICEESPQSGLLRKWKLYIDVAIAFENSTRVYFLTIKPFREFSLVVVKFFFIDSFFEAIHFLFASVKPNPITFIIAYFKRCLICDDIIFEEGTFALGK